MRVVAADECVTLDLPAAGDTAAPVTFHLGDLWTDLVAAGVAEKQ